MKCSTPLSLLAWTTLPAADCLSGPFRWLLHVQKAGQNILGSPAVVGYSFTLCMTPDNSYVKQRHSALFFIFNFFLLKLRCMDSLRYWVSVFSQCCHKVLCADFKGWYLLIDWLCLVDAGIQLLQRKQWKKEYSGELFMKINYFFLSIK